MFLGNFNWLNWFYKNGYMVFICIMKFKKLIIVVWYEKLVKRVICIKFDNLFLLKS